MGASPGVLLSGFGGRPTRNARPRPWPATGGTPVDDLVFPSPLDGRRIIEGIKLVDGEGASRMKLPGGLSAPEIRILQEYRRAGVQTMTMAEIREIRHPSKVGDEAVDGLVTKGYVTRGEGDETFALTENGTSFLERNPVPEFADAGS